MLTNETLTVSDLVALAAIVDAVQRNARVGWLMPNGDVATGTVRSLGDERGGFIGSGEDVRDAFVRITTSSGWEVFAPIAKVAEQYAKSAFVIDYQD